MSTVFTSHAKDQGSMAEALKVTTVHSESRLHLYAADKALKK